MAPLNWLLGKLGDKDHETMDLDSGSDVEQNKHGGNNVQPSCSEEGSSLVKLKGKQGLCKNLQAEKWINIRLVFLQPRFTLDAHTPSALLEAIWSPFESKLNKT